MERIRFDHAEFEKLKKNILSKDHDIAISSSDRLAEIGGDEVVDFLISLLKASEQHTRNYAALALREIADNRALDPLLNAIFKKENHNHNQTLVYALETLDCSNHLVEIFKILFYESYVGKISASKILDEQIFSFTKQDLLTIEMMWEDCKLNPEKHFLLSEETILDIQNSVDGYLAYLQPDSPRNQNENINP